MHLFRKIPTRLRLTNFCPSSACFAPSFIRQQNGPECTQIVEHYKTSVYCPMGWIGCVRCEKIRSDFVARTFALVRPVFHQVSQGNQTVPNTPKWYETRQNISLGSNGVDRVRSLRTIPMRLRGTNFCPSSARFTASFVRHPNVPNAPK